MQQSDDRFTQLCEVVQRIVTEATMFWPVVELPRHVQVLSELCRKEARVLPDPVRRFAVGWSSVTLYRDERFMEAIMVDPKEIGSPRDELFEYHPIGTVNMALVLFALVTHELRCKGRMPPGTLRTAKALRN